MTKILDLAKQLVTIPSWVGKSYDEIKIGQFIYDWLRANTNLQVVKQLVTGGRFNVIAFDNKPTKLLLVGHFDTMEDRAGWTTDPWTPVVKNDRLYGLGATDMKGSLATMLTAVSELKNTDGLMVLCYIDEEYDFAGMRQFIKEYKDKIEPTQIVSLDGSAGQIGTGCRGLIEVSFRLRGQTGHAGRPEAGVNAIVSGLNCINKLKRQLATKYTEPNLGVTTLNVAYCQGRLDNGAGGYGRQGNNIADLAEFVLDIRTASNVLNAEKVLEILLSYASAGKLQLENWVVRHDLGMWSTPKELLLSFFGNEYRYEPSLGYIDTQMLWNSFGQVPCCTIGAGNLALAHKPNEYVEIANLESTKLLVEKIIQRRI
jgi:acetylornithine deacetylase/succinyl-diaminopimelate desuccinylase-like protein